MLTSLPMFNEPTMDIYSEPGTKVRFTGRNGSDCDLLMSKSYLVVGRVYTVDHTEVANYSTDVFLKEFPDVPFNSVHFQPA